jgi:hypothetical protein
MRNPECAYDFLVADQDEQVGPDPRGTATVPVTVGIGGRAHVASGVAAVT